MASLLNGLDQKYVAEKKVLSKNDTTVEYEVTLNQTLQKDVYEKVYQVKAKEIEIKGFRKGEAPRSMVEGQIYSDLTKDVIDVLVNNAVSELIESEKINTILMPEVTNITFTLVESPLKFTVKIEVLGDYKVPNLKDFQISVGDLAVKDEEVSKAKTTIWEDWQKRAKPEEKEKYKEISEEWITNELKVPHVKTEKELEALIRDEIIHSKLHQEEDQKISEAIKGIVEKMKIQVPESFVKNNVEETIKKQEEQIKKYGMTWEDYLKHYKKTDEEFRKEIADSASQQYREEAFWNVYIKEKDVKIDPQSKDDQVFVNYAASSMQITAGQKLEQNTVNRILRLALMYKALHILRNELGIEEHNHEKYSKHDAGHDHDHEGHDHSHDAEG